MDAPKKEQTSSGWQVDISKWKMKHFKAWKNATTEGDLDAVWAIVVDATVAMPNGVKPTIEMLDELDLSEWREGVASIGKALSEKFRAD